ncbi:MAG: hypothetical protein K2X93_27335 [Candidatus Obscuribacterales bacterium]|nr:hypothetical protein [Candidatus Obscuribacterales bacterium]
MQLSSRLIVIRGLGIACSLVCLATPAYADPLGSTVNKTTARPVADVQPLLIAAGDSAGPEGAGPERAPPEVASPEVAPPKGPPPEGPSADEVFRRYEQPPSRPAQLPGHIESADGVSGSSKRLIRADSARSEEALRPQQSKESLVQPDSLGAQSSGSRDDSPVTTPRESLAPGSGVRAPFNLGVNQSVIDGSADESSMNLQSGAQQGALDNRFPPLNANTSRGALNGGVQNGAPLSGGLTQAQLQRLANHDLVLIIDQSGSMMTADCPISGMGRVGGTVMTMLLGSAASVSRWRWCRDQTMSLAENTRNVCTKGFSVVLFSTNYAVFPHVTLDQIPSIFTQTYPQGGTNLTEPLLATINDYIGRRHRAYVKPLAIAIITDGKPSYEDGVRRTIVETTLRMKDPGEIKITFFLIGNSAYNGQAFVSDMERNLQRYGAKFNVVRSVSFWNLMKVGLPRALADALE